MSRPRVAIDAWTSSCVRVELTVSRSFVGTPRTLGVWSPLHYFCDRESPELEEAIDAAQVGTVVRSIERALIAAPPRVTRLTDRFAPAEFLRISRRHGSRSPCESPYDHMVDGQNLVRVTGLVVVLSDGAVEEVCPFTRGTGTHGPLRVRSTCRR